MALGQQSQQFLLDGLSILALIYFAFFSLLLTLFEIELLFFFLYINHYFSDSRATKEVSTDGTHPNWHCLLVCGVFVQVSDHLSF